MTKLLKVREVADRLGCTTTYVYMLVKAGKLDSVSIGSRAIRITEESLDRFLERGKSMEAVPEEIPTILPPSEFWEAKDFDILAMEQGIYPIEDFNEISGGFPEDADFDAFFRAIMSSRED